MLIGAMVLIGGVWVTQDAIASLLYYINKPEEKWYYNQACRGMRLLWGVVLVICGLDLLGIM
jgi:hypothetical protein